MGRNYCCILHVLLKICSQDRDSEGIPEVLNSHSPEQHRQARRLRIDGAETKSIDPETH